MRQAVRALIFVCGLAFVGEPAAAKTADGRTPADETVCDGLRGAAFGICNAYCEATDCDGDSNANARACARLRAIWVKRTGLQDLPCDCVEPFVFDRAAGCICGLTQQDCAPGEELDPAACRCIALPTPTNTATATSTPTGTPTHTHTATPTDLPTATSTPDLQPDEQDTIRCLCCDPNGNCTELDNLCVPTTDCRGAEDQCTEICPPDNTVEDWGCVEHDCLDGSETPTTTPTATVTPAGPTDTPTPAPTLRPEEQDTIGCLCCDPEGVCTQLEGICIPTIDCRDVEGACEDACPPDSVVEDFDCTPNDCAAG